MQTVHPALADLYIDDENYGSDHFPLMIVANFEDLPNTLIGLQSESKIKCFFFSNYD